ncbi:MAG TPA: hypothetical protein VLK35_15970 [Methylomirabilota bacterium]|nr:hypothetical protein [Methylomirabilota bacterium]
MDFSIIARDVDRDEEAGPIFLPTPWAYDFQGGPLLGKLDATAARAIAQRAGAEPAETPERTISLPK